MSEEGADETDRRSLMRAGAVASIPLLAGATGVASASTNHDHLGETWDGSKGLTIIGYDEPPLYLVSQSSTGNPALRADGVDAGNPAIKAESYQDSKIAIRAVNSNSDGHAVLAEGNVRVEGDFTATGSKNFAQTVQTEDGPREVAYTAVEADRAQTETTGVARLDDGRAEIDLPDHFGLVTSEEAELVVQLTPYDIDAPRLAVTERSTDRIVVEAADPADTEFSYTVRGVREGYEDEPVIEEPPESVDSDATESADADVERGATDSEFDDGTV